MQDSGYTIGDRFVEELRSDGYEAFTVDLNNNCRPEKGAADLMFYACYQGQIDGHSGRWPVRKS